jgi:hypothetical protein
MGCGGLPDHSTIGRFYLYIYLLKSQEEKPVLFQKSKIGMTE